MILERISIWHN